MKWLYNFIDPNRFDVIVFRNPTSSLENYIKRLVGLPNEEIWLADGDVFVRRAGDVDAPFHVQRKPEHVQRSVWRTIDDRGAAPQSPVDAGAAGRDGASPWAGAGWDTSGRALRCDDAGETMLRWNNRVRPIDDWLAYNAFKVVDPGSHFAVSDLRIRAGVVADEPDLVTALQLHARAHVFEWRLGHGEALVRLRPANSDAWTHEARADFSGFDPGFATNIEFWHADQRLAIYADGDLIVELTYDWGPALRLERATGASVEAAMRRVPRSNPWYHQFRPSEPQIEWSFQGSPLTLHRVGLDRDLYYQPDVLDPTSEPALGTHPGATAVTGPDQFFMLGDNSAHSQDSRLWGHPDRYVAEQIDPTPYLVHRSLIVGKAWCVYFPSPFALSEGGARFVPDFGRMRFIR
jgi:hypothetical protein